MSLSLGVQPDESYSTIRDAESLRGARFWGHAQAAVQRLLAILTGKLIRESKTRIEQQGVGHSNYYVKDCSVRIR